MSQESFSEMDASSGGSQSSVGEFGTPIKESSERGRDLQVTPSASSSTSLKRKLEFDFWTKESSTPIKKEKSGDLNIGEIESGKGQENMIQFRVSNKSAKITSKAGNMMFKFHALDASGEIAIVAYGQAAETWFDVVMFNKTFKMSNFDAKEENLNYRSTTGHSLELVLNTSTIIEEIKDVELPAIPFDFVDINEVLEKPDKSTVDTMAIMVKVWDLETLKNTVKRDLAMTDKTKSVVVTTLWGKQAENFDEELYTIFAIRKGSTASFSGKCTLNIFSGTLLWASPDLDEAKDLAQWFEDNKPQ